jgi:hypothetical protein
MTAKQQQKALEEGCSEPLILVGCCFNQQGQAV